MADELDKILFGGDELDSILFEQPVQPQRPSLTDRVKNILEQRVGNIGSLSEGKYGEGQTDLPVALRALPIAGEVGGGMFDVGMELGGAALSAVTPDFIEDPVKEYVGGLVGEAGEAVSESGIVEPAAELLSQGGKYIDEFKRNYPATAAQISGLGGVIEGLPVAQAGRFVAPMVAEGVKAAVPKVKIGLTEAGKALKGTDAPSIDDIRTTEKALWQNLDTDAKTVGTVIKPNAVNKSFSKKLKSAMESDRLRIIDADVHPQAAAAIGKINERTSGARQMTPAAIQDTKELIDGYISKSMDGFKETKDTLRLYAIKDAFDDSIDALTPKDFLKGDKSFYDNWKEARRVSSLRYKADALEDLVDRAEFHAKNSSPEIALKNEFRNLAKNKKRMKQFNAEEQFYIKKAAQTGKIEGLLEKMSGFSPLSGKLGMVSSGMTGVMYDPAVAAGLAILGTGARAASGAITKAKPKKAIESVTKQLKPQEKSRKQLAFEKLKAQKGAK